MSDTEQKPVIIYSMPRTKSTATLQACVRPIKLHEPFDLMTLHGQTDRSWNLYPDYAGRVRNSEWSSIKEDMEDPSSATKFFGNSLLTFPPAREWFKSVDEAKSHDIFVLIRDRKEIAWSFLLAHKFGWVKNDTKINMVEMEERLFFYLSMMFDSFLRFMPTNAKLITFTTLPTSHFDKQEILIQEQNSLLHKYFVKNFSFCELQIDNIIKCYDEEWNRKLSRLQS